MKNNLGKIILVFFITSHFALFASEYTWNTHINKSKAYVNEVVYLKYTCKFSDKAGLYAIEFNPVGMYENYEIKLLSKKEEIKNSKRINTYEYVAFIKKAGDIKFDFDVNMKKTNKDSIKSTVLGRDNLEYEEYTSKKLKLKTLHIKAINSDVDLVGIFDIEIKKDEVNIKAYEPYHLQVTISGSGNLDKIKAIELNFENAKVFKNEPVKNYVLTKDGYEGSWSQKFAIVSENDIEFSHIKIDYYDLKEKKKKSLTLDAFVVNVKKAYAKNELLDEVKNEKFNFKDEYFYYLLTFIAGFLIAKIKFKKKNAKTKNEAFNKKIQNAKTIDELLIILILQDSNKYKNIIKKIENKEIISLNSIKKYYISKY